MLDRPKTNPVYAGQMYQLRHEWAGQRRILRLLLAARACQSYQALSRLHRRRDEFNLRDKPKEGSAEYASWADEHGIITTALYALSDDEDYVFENIHEIEELGGQFAIDEYGLDLDSEELDGYKFYGWTLASIPVTRIFFVTKAGELTGACFGPALNPKTYGATAGRLVLEASDLNLAKQLLDYLLGNAPEEA